MVSRAFLFSSAQFSGTVCHLLNFDLQSSQNVHSTAKTCKVNTIVFYTFHFFKFMLHIVLSAVMKSE